MTSRLPLVLVLCMLAAGTLAGQQTPAAFLPVADIRPGMVGIGRTVFEGTRVEEFRAHILGVLENVMGPRRNLILARLEGGPLAETGVIAGMSGSPVYVDGRLIGAVSYSLGSFSKEPLAGITPIEEMTDAAGMDAPRSPVARLRVDFPMTPASLSSALGQALAGTRAFADRPGDARLVGVNAVAGFGSGELGAFLKPIGTPLVMAGFEPGLAQTLGDVFADYGFVPTGGTAGARPGDMPFEGPLKPGDAIGVAFMTGDLLLGGTGTVTHVDGDRVYAFGHPMYNLGPTQFPMTRAYVYALLPSLFTSTKISGTGDTIGTLLQDRATTIAGRLGPGPSMIPVSMTLEPERGAARTFRFEVVRDQIFTTLMTYSALLTTLSSNERQFGVATYQVSGEARVAGHAPVRFDNLFSGESISVNAASYAIAPLTAIMANVDEEVTVEGLDLTFRSAEEPRTATIERVWIDDPRPRAGRTVDVKVQLRTYRGDDVLHTVSVPIPAHVTGPLSLVVSDGTLLNQVEQREVRQPQTPRTVAQIVRTINGARRGHTIYLKLMHAASGAVVNGERLSALPPSVLAVHESDRSGGSFGPLSSATLGEWPLVTSYAVSGSRTLAMVLSSN